MSMLSGSATTDRPRPPAKVKARRSASASTLYKSDGVGASPPPPYATSSFAFPNKHEAHPVDDSDPQLPRDESQDEREGTNLGWFREKSREELSDLLLKADGLIKDRESELDIASAAVKSLYDNNVALKSQHQTLLARIPGSPALPGTPVLASPYHSVSATHTPHFYSDNPLSQSFLDSVNSSSSTYSFKRHTRKISVSQHDISLLADQNAELLQKLERLEAESATADRSGRRVLKRLEREISLLRDELDRTQVQSKELEEKAQLGALQPLTFEELSRRKSEREARTKALRPSSSNETIEDAEVRDFAPENPWSAVARGPRLHAAISLDSILQKSRSFTTDDSLSSVAASTSRGPLTQVLEHDEAPTPLGLSSETPGETALISQLLLKIKELEDTNSRILSQQEETTRKLRDVQKETEGMSRIYECLNDQDGIIELEMVDEVPLAGPSTPERPTDARQGQNTIRFRSLRKTLEADLAKALSTSDANDSQRQTHHGHRPRKSVMDLFDFPQSSQSSGPPVPFPPGDEGQNPLSPALSTLSISSAAHAYTPNHYSSNSQSFSEAPSPFNSISPSLKPTLDSELGSELSTWNLDAQNYHLRTTSLGSIYNYLSLPGSPSPTPSSSIRQHQDMTTLSGATTPSLLMSIDEPVTPVAAPGLQLEPPTPDKASSSSTGVVTIDSSPVTTSDRKTNSSGAVSPQTVRYRKLSQTVRGRTAKWASNRFNNSLSSIFGVDREKVPEELDSSQKKEEGDRLPKSEATISTPKLPEHSPIKTRSGESQPPAKTASPPSAIDTALEMILERFSGVANVSVSQHDPANDGDAEGDHQQQPAPPKPQSNVVKMILEFWLWLQFIIILLVFVGAMFHRGPRSILADSKSRRAVERR